MHFHAAGQAAAGKGELNYVNYWPALTPTVAKSLTEWWGRILVLSPLGESQLSYSATASIPARSAQSVDIGGHLGPPLLVFSLLRGGPSNEALLRGD